MKQVGKEKHIKHQKMIKKVKQAYKKNSRPSTRTSAAR